MGTVDLNLLPAFVAVAETMSFSAAAARLDLPKSSVSRRVAALERAMGVPLFHRTTRRVSLSTAGTALRDQIGSPLAALQTSVGALPELEEEPSGRLRVTAAVDLGTAVLAEIVARFVARYPKVELDLRLTNASVDLVAEGVDVALRIATRPLKDSAMIARRVAPIAIKLFASPTYLARRSTPRVPADLAAHSWVAFRDQRALRLSGPGRPTTIRPRGTIVCDDMFFLRETLRHGAGIGMLPTFLAERDVTAGDLVCVTPRWSVPTGVLWIVRPGGAHVPRKVIAFEEFVRAALLASPLTRDDA